MLGLVLLIVLILLLAGSFPHWGAHDWGYYPSGGIGLVLIIILILILLGRI